MHSVKTNVLVCIIAYFVVKAHPTSVRSVVFRPAKELHLVAPAQRRV